ncbi:MAG: hypothetical protein V7724_03140 [Sediminicola sp.]|tara:strand:- start:78487 stop:79098 length:612 start_codon:yes stop_codon:yes gene_type:complete
MKRTVILIQLLILVFFACSPEDGQDGAIGPQGPQGEQGIAGQQGPAGQDGEDGQDGSEGEPGTANVIYSDWFTLPFPDDINSTTNYGAGIVANDVTENIVNNSVTLIYGRSDTTVLIPQLLPFSAFAEQQYYAPGFRAPTESSPTGRVSVTIYSMDGSPIGIPIFEEYRYVIIPGGIPTSGKSSIDYTQLSYEEIIDLYHIPE